MRLIVAPQSEVAAALLRWRPGLAVSLVSPRVAPPRMGDGVEHWIFQYHDIEGAPPRRPVRPGRPRRPPLVPPSRSDVAALVQIGRGARDDDTILIHCTAGLGRAPAAALVIAWAARPDIPFARHAGRLAALTRWAQPNRRIVALAAQELRADPESALVALAEAFPVRRRLDWGADGANPGAVLWPL